MITLDYDITHNYQEQLPIWRELEVLFGMSWGIALISILLVIVHLSKKGTSNDLRIKVLKRHFIYTVIYITQTTLLVIIMNGQLDSWLYLFAQLMGFLLALMRCLEPYVYLNLKHQITKHMLLRKND